MKFNCLNNERSVIGHQKALTIAALHVQSLLSTPQVVEIKQSSKGESGEFPTLSFNKPFVGIE